MPFIPRSILRMALLGAGVGAVLGAVFMLISLIGGDRTWVAMVLFAGVASWPAGLWPLDMSEGAVRAGIWGARYLPFLGPLLNGLVCGAALGCLDYLGRGRHKPASDS